jgi:hypothetical protein
MSLDDITNEDLIYEYTSQQALEDGILFDVTRLNPDLRDGPFNYVTTSLLALGYITHDKSNGKPAFNYINILDLLVQAQQIVKLKSKNGTQPDWFYDGKIELPSGQSQKIFIAQNETGKYTIMLPSDY